MEDKERYVVCTTDGKAYTMVGKTFGQILQEFGEANVWQILRLDFEEVNNG